MWAEVSFGAGVNEAVAAETNDGQIFQLLLGELDLRFRKINFSELDAPMGKFAFLLAGRFGRPAFAARWRAWHFRIPSLMAAWHRHIPILIRVSSAAACGRGQAAAAKDRRTLGHDYIAAAKDRRTLGHNYIAAAKDQRTLGRRARPGHEGKLKNRVWYNLCG